MRDSYCKAGSNFSVEQNSSAEPTMSRTPQGHFAPTAGAVGIDSSTAEGIRLQEDKNGDKDWRQWGPYLSERQWSTVREDYSPNGTWYVSICLQFFL